MPGDDFDLGMSRTRLRQLLGLLILLISLALLLWGLWPMGTEVRTLPVQPVDLSLPTPVGWLLAAWSI